MKEKIDKEEFFKNCEYVAKAPACIFLEGNRFSKKAKVLPVSLYAYAGIEKGNFKNFYYEEYNTDLERLRNIEQNTIEGLMDGLKKDTKNSDFDVIDEDKIEQKCLLKRPEAEREMLRTGTIISCKKKEREFGHSVYLEREVKKRLVWEQVAETKENNAIISVFTPDKEKSKLAMEKAKNAFNKLLPKFKGYFKVKVWSDVPYASGMNDGAAIAVAVTLVLKAKLSKDKEEFEKLMSNLQVMREKHPEEIIVSNDFADIFSVALSLDFLSNGAAVFASLVGCTSEQRVIDYECLFYNEFKDFYRPYPDNKNLKKVMDFVSKYGIEEYFTKCVEILAKPLTGIPLFKWSLSKFTFKDKDFPLSFKTIYSSRKQGWGAKGAEVIESEKAKAKTEKTTLASEREKEKAEYARMWSNETKMEGESISKEDLNKLIDNKVAYQIFIIDHGEYEMDSVGEVYCDDEPLFPYSDRGKKITGRTQKRKIKSKQGKNYLKPIQYRILFHALKHKGIAGDLFALIEKCWFDNQKAHYLRKLLKEVIRGKKIEPNLTI